MIGKALIISIIVYAILYGLGDYYDTLNYIRSIFGIIIFCCCVSLIIKGIVKIIKHKNKNNTVKSNLIFKGI